MVVEDRPRGAKAKDAPKKMPTVEPKYDTIAGNDGVWFWSDPIPIEKGKAYWLTLDVKGPPHARLAGRLPGESRTPRSGPTPRRSRSSERNRERASPSREAARLRAVRSHKYVWNGPADSRAAPTSGTPISRRGKPFRPTAARPSVKYVRVLIYPFWPPGEYYVDNVRLYEVKE